MSIQQTRPDRWRRQTTLIGLIAFSIVGWNSLGVSAYGAERLVSAAQARHLGLERAWFAQVRLDRARNRVERAVLEGDRLTVMSSAGVLHEFNALTGETMWIAPVGNPNYPSLGPTASKQFVALLNGSTLYVVDRVDGRPVLVRQVGGSPGAAPALAEKYVFVPLVTGRIEAYPLGEQKLTPWYYQSFGRAMVAPLATADSFVWSTDSGHLYVGRSDDLGVRFRLETRSEIVASPASRSPYVYAATITGEVFAMHEMTGVRRWKYATGFPVMRAPAAVGAKVFVTTQEPMLHCIDAERGISLWETPNIAQFAAASASRVYCVSKLGALVALDIQTGAMLGRMQTDAATHALVNDQTDRVYLVSEDGIVQCLHEIGAKAPIYHRPKTEPATTEEQPTTGDTTSQPPAEEETEPAEEAADEEAADEEATEEMPAEEGDFGVDEDPFEAFGEE